MASLLENLAKQFGQTPSAQIGQAVETMVGQALERRKTHERRWYDNNFFDDGYHFRVISKKTGKVIDHAGGTGSYAERAIPRASRQIRGVSNLLFAAEPYPVVYPERITKEDFQDPKAYEQAQEQAKSIARKRGLWLTTQWQEEQELDIKLINMILKAAKNSVSWMQVYTDDHTKKICTEVFDAFDIICFGDMEDEQKLPFITKAKSMELEDILGNPLFDPAMVKKLTPDNKYATSEVKEAYMRSRYGAKSESSEEKGSVMVKETFLKEVLSEDNWKLAVKLGSDTGAMEGKSQGDTIMRHVFSAGGVTLADEYVDYDEYPLVPFRFEPGPIYQVPFIERFIPQNKSVDVIVTRLEKWVNAMVVGVYQRRKGETFQISNAPGMQIIDFEQTPLQQMNQSNVGNTPFQVIDLLNRYLEEQGSTTAALGQLPTGVKSGVAIESVKSTEYANLKIPTLMLKQTIKHVAERMLERADKDFLEPQEVATLENGQAEYFDVIGKRGFELHQKLNKQLPQDTVVLDRKARVRIEIEPGLGLTMEGKRQAMQTIIEKVLEMNKAQPGIIPPEAFQMIIQKFLESFGYGSTQELIEAMEHGLTTAQLTEQQITEMKIALAETLKDVGAVGPEMDNKLVDAAKLGTLESLKDAGMLDGMGEKEQDKTPSQSIPFKELPVEGKIQMAAAAGIQLTPQQIMQHEQREQQIELEKAKMDMAMKAQEHQQKMAMRGEELQMKQVATEQDLNLKQKVGEETLRMKQDQTKQSMTLKERQGKQSLELQKKQAQAKAKAAATKPKTNGVKK